MLGLRPCANFDRDRDRWPALLCVLRWCLALMSLTARAAAAARATIASSHPTLFFCHSCGAAAATRHQHGGEKEKLLLLCGVRACLRVCLY